MIKTRTALPLMAALSALSFGTFAADSISLQQAQNWQPTGSVSVSGIDGARTYHVTETYEHGNWHATAQLYK